MHLEQQHRRSTFESIGRGVHAVHGNAWPLLHVYRKLDDMCLQLVLLENEPMSSTVQNGGALAVQNRQQTRQTDNNVDLISCTVSSNNARKV